METENPQYRTIALQLDVWPTRVMWTVVVRRWAPDGGRTARVLRRGEVPLPDRPKGGWDPDELLALVVQSVWPV